MQNIETQTENIETSAEPRTCREKSNLTMQESEIRVITMCNLPKSYFLQVEGILYDARGGHPHPENILLGG